MRIEDEAGSPLAAPPGNAKFPLLDGLRGVAALLVLAYHWVRIAGLRGPAVAIPAHGNVGVIIFFVLSGFLIYRPFVVAQMKDRRVRVRQFYLRRAVRIVPAYWVALTVVAISFGVPRFHDRWWQLYLFGQIYTPSMVFSAGLGPAWSLCIEVSFYLILPLYALAARQVFRFVPKELLVLVEVAGLALLAVASIVCHRMMGSIVGASSFTLPGTFYLFSAGMALAVISAKTTMLDRLSKGWMTASWVLGVVLYIVISYTMSAESLGSVNPLYAPSAVLVLLPAIASKGVNRAGLYGRFLVSRPLAALGLISYAFYLWHQVLMERLVIFVSQPLLLLAVALMTTSLVAAVSYILIERLALRVLHRRAEGRAASLTKTA